MRGIGCISPTLTLKEKNKIFFFQDFLFFVEYKPMKTNKFVDENTIALLFPWM